MGLENALLIATVAHARMRPKRNAFQYRVYYLSVALSLWQEMKRLSVLSLEKFNVFTVRECDYGDGPTPEAWIRGLLAQRNLTAANGDVVLVSLPRVLGYLFNPVSFWFCLDNAGAPRAVLAEVRNTFGEKHSYLLAHEDQRVITGDDWFSKEKIFHVSPFIEVGGHYEFRFAYGEEKIGVWINHHDAEGLLLTTSLVGKRYALTSKSLLVCFFSIPWVTFKVIALIHYQALKLYIKGVRYRVKPTPPTHEIS